MAYDEASVVKASGTPVNKSGTGLTVTSVSDDEGPFNGMQAVTTNDVDGTSARGGNVKPIKSAKAE